MSETVKNWLLGVTSALCVPLLGMCIGLYVDVQLLKVNVDRYSDMAIQQKQMKELITKLDKNLAVQEETLRTLIKAVERSNRG